MERYCHHLGIFTAHPDRLKRFYIGKLGFKLDSEREIDKKIFRQIFGINTSCQLIRLNLDKVSLELFYPSQFRLKKYLKGTAGYNHWALNVYHKARFCSLAKKKGVRVIKVKRSGYYTYFIQDPDGNLIEIKDDRF